MIAPRFLYRLGLVVGLGWAGNAHATATNWSFIETALYQARPGLGTSGYLNYDIGPAIPIASFVNPAAQLTLSDTALQRGTVSFDFVFTVQDFFGHVVPGSDTDFAFNTLPIAGIFGPAVQLPAATCCETTAHLALNLSGGALSGVLDFFNWADDIHMPITNNVVALGFAAADFEIFGCFGQCLFSGYWVDVTPVPEPGSLLLSLTLILLGAAMLAKCEPRRGRRFLAFDLNSVEPLPRA